MTIPPDTKHELLARGAERAADAHDDAGCALRITIPPGTGPTVTVTRPTPGGDDDVAR